MTTVERLRLRGSASSDIAPPVNAQPNRLPYIDVLRAVAILSVLFRHLPPDLGIAFGALHEWGGRGVDLFFALSGFLIGTTCLQRAERYPEQRGKQAAAYWLLRSLRIFPLYFGLLALFALGPSFINPDVTHVIRNYTLPFVTFTSNYLAQSTLELGIYWSLAIEEQFYLAVGLLVAATSRRRDTLAAAFLGLALVTVAVSVFHRREIAQRLLTGSLEEKWFTFDLFHSTLSRMDQLALGLTSAVVARWFDASRLGNSSVAPRLVTWSSIALAIAVILFFPHKQVYGFTVMGVVFAAIVLLAQRPTARTELKGVEALLLKPLLSIGKLSFGLYLLHPLLRPAASAITTWAHVATDGLGAASLYLGVWLALTWVLAAVSYRFFETPFLNFARRRAAALLGPTPDPAPVTTGDGAPAR